MVSGLSGNLRLTPFRDRNRWLARGSDAISQADRRHEAVIVIVPMNSGRRVFKPLLVFVGTCATFEVKWSAAWAISANGSID